MIRLSNPLKVGAAGVRSDLRGLRTGLRRGVRGRVVAHLSRARSRWLHRGVVLWFLMVVVPLVLAPPSFAAAGRGIPWLSWLNDKDTYGFYLDQYQLTVSVGGITDPPTMMGSWLLKQFWMVYSLVIAVGVWGMDFVLQFKFLAMVRGPANTMAEVVQRVIDQIGVVPLMVTAAAVLAGFWVYKGRTGAAFGEMAVSAVIAALIGMAAFNPVSIVTGPHGGLAKAQQLGAGMTLQLMSTGGAMPGGPGTDLSKGPGSGGGGQDPSKAVQSAASAKLIETFIREPQQLINFGMSIDGKGTSAKCQKDYDSWMRGHSIKPMGKDCPKIVDYTIGHPQNSLPAAYVVGPAAVFLAIWVVVLLLITGFLTGLAAFESAKFFWSLVKGILPGSGREEIFESACTALMCMAYLAAAVMSVGLYVLVINAVFSQRTGWNPIVVFLVIDLVLVAMVIGLIVHMFQVRKRGKAMGRKAANSIAPKPRSVPRGPSTARVAMSGAKTGMSMLRQKQMSGALSAARGSGSGGNARPAAPVGSGPRVGPSGTRPSSGGFVRSSAKLAGKAAVIGLQATVGAPVAAPKAAKAAQAAWDARKAALQKKLSDAKAGAAGSVRQRTDAVGAYASEYKHNVGAAAKFMARGVANTGATAAGGVPPNAGPSKTSDGGSRPKPGAGPTKTPAAAPSVPSREGRERVVPQRADGPEHKTRVRSRVADQPVAPGGSGAIRARQRAQLRAELHAARQAS